MLFIFAKLSGEKNRGNFNSTVLGGGRVVGISLEGRLDRLPVPYHDEAFTLNITRINPYI